MEKELSDMTLQELWQLFPIILKKHNPDYQNWYFTEKENILKVLPQNVCRRINHIGSTSVPELIAKPTIDILLEIDSDACLSDVKKALLQAGFFVMTENTTIDLFMCAKGYTNKGFAKKVFHLHVRYYGDPDELYFRDYLICHSDIADAYGKLKCSLLEKFVHNRDGYTEAKTDFVCFYTQKARHEFANRYDRS